MVCRVKSAAHWIALSLVAGVVGVAGCGGDDEASPSPAAAAPAAQPQGSTTVDPAQVHAPGSPEGSTDDSAPGDGGTAPAGATQAAPADGAEEAPGPPGAGGDQPAQPTGGAHNPSGFRPSLAGEPADPGSVPSGNLAGHGANDPSTEPAPTPPTGVDLSGQPDG